MILILALCLSLLLLVSFDNTATGIIVALLWTLVSLFAFQSPTWI